MTKWKADWYEDYEARGKRMYHEYHLLTQQQKLFINALTSFLSTERTAEILAINLSLNSGNENEFERLGVDPSLRVAQVSTATKVMILEKHVEDLNETLSPKEKYSPNLQKIAKQLRKKIPVDLRMMKEIIDYEYEKNDN